MSCVRPYGLLAVRPSLHGKNFNVRHCMQTFQPYLLMDTIDFYPFILVSLTLTFGSHVSAKQNLLASFSCTLALCSCTLFSWSGWNFIWCWSNLCWTSQYCIWVRFDETRENTCCFTDCQKTLTLACIQTFMNQFGWNLWCDDRYYSALHFDTSLLGPDLGSRSQECETFFHQSEWNLVYCWDMLIWWTSYSFYFIHLIFKGENPTYVILLELMQSFCCKDAGSNSHVCDGWSCQGDAGEEVMLLWRMCIVWAFAILFLWDLLPSTLSELVRRLWNLLLIWTPWYWLKRSRLIAEIVNGWRICLLHKLSDLLFFVGSCNIFSVYVFYSYPVLLPCG